MKKLLFLCMAAVVLLSCTNNKEYTINGTVVDPAYEGKNVYVQSLGDNQMNTLDTLVITDGKFSMKGVADSTFLRFFLIDESVNPKGQNRIPVLVEPGTIEIKFDSVVTVRGTGANNDYTDFRLKQRDLNNDARSVLNEYNSAVADGTMNDALEAEIKETFDKLQDEIYDVNVNYVKNNMKNELGKYIFMTTSGLFKLEEQKEILKLADDEYRSRENIQRIVRRIENAENVAVGKNFVDFTMKDPQGNDVSLSDYVGQGKYVLLDFWASWCGPCRREMPHIVDVYKKYKNKDFEVVGVSLDQNHDDWVKGLKDLNMTWPQMSDLKYWESPVVELYAFNGIPHMILLDKDGKILEKNLRGSELDEKIGALVN